MVPGNVNKVDIRKVVTGASLQRFLQEKSCCKMVHDFSQNPLHDCDESSLGYLR